MELEQIVNQFRWDRKSSMTNNLNDLLVFINFYHPSIKTIYYDTEDKVLSLDVFNKEVVKTISIDFYTNDSLIDYNRVSIERNENYIMELEDIMESGKLLRDSYIEKHIQQKAINHIVSDLVDNFIYRCRLFEDSDVDESYKVIKHRFPFLDKFDKGSQPHLLEMSSSQYDYLIILFIKLPFGE